jgi:hypothetical protein
MKEFTSQITTALQNIDNYVVRCIAIHATLRRSHWSAL